MANQTIKLTNNRLILGVKPTSLSLKLSNVNQKLSVSSNNQQLKVTSQNLNLDTAVNSLELGLTNNELVLTLSRVGGQGIPGKDNVQILTTDPTDPVKGDFWYNTTSNVLKLYDGTKVDIVSLDSSKFSEDYNDLTNKPTTITPAQAAAIIVNSAKVGITPEQVADILANSLKVGITTAQSQAILDNSNKVGITPEQSSAIQANSGKVGITSEQSSAITANTNKVGITSEQSNAIQTNSNKVGITSTQSDAIAANSLKVGITTDQSDAITANTLKTAATFIVPDDLNIDGSTLQLRRGTTVIDSVTLPSTGGGGGVSGATQAQIEAIALNTAKFTNETTWSDYALSGLFVSKSTATGNLVITLTYGGGSVFREVVKTPTYTDTIYSDSELTQVLATRGG